MVNRRRDVPAGWTWRDGRPRWVPSPTLRGLGWKGCDLRDGKGRWLERGASIDAAQAIADAVAAWRGGAAAPVTLAHIAPAGAAAAPQASGAADPFTIGAMLDAYLASPELTTKRDGQPRPRATVEDYRRKLKRLVDALAGYARLPDPAKELEDYKRAVAAVRASSVFILEPVETPEGLTDPLHAAYGKLQTHAGKHMAFGVMNCASAWLAWCRRRRSRSIVNWAKDVQRETPPGRIRVMTWPEIAALVEAADTSGRPEVADALLLAIDLSWSQVDIIGLTWDRVVKDDGGRWRCLGARQKTGRKGGTPLLGLGLRRLKDIRARQEAMDAQPLKVIHLTRQRKHRQLGPQADGDYLRDLFEDVRALAAKKVPTCATLTFADTRDTGFSLGRQAGLSDDGTASRTLQSRANIKALGDRHYGEIGPEIANQQADVLDAYVEAELLKHGVKL